MRTQCSTFFVDDAHLASYVEMLASLRLSLVTVSEAKAKENGGRQPLLPVILMLDELGLSLIAAREAGYHGDVNPEPTRGKSVVGPNLDRR